mmetsp:Transcript_13880/g.36750  ORF Transcript_13880/g.36750 Transcript_13880/m.36750 type:complete len:240 (+) Transcript_13880:159-878(+)
MALAKVMWRNVRAMRKRPISDSTCTQTRTNADIPVLNTDKSIRRNQCVSIAHIQRTEYLNSTACASGQSSVGQLWPREELNRQYNMGSSVSIPTKRLASTKLKTRKASRYMPGRTMNLRIRVTSPTWYAWKLSRALTKRSLNMVPRYMTALPTRVAQRIDGVFAVLSFGRIAWHSMNTARLSMNQILEAMNLWRTMPPHSVSDTRMMHGCDMISGSLESTRFLSALENFPSSSTIRCFT